MLRIAAGLLASGCLLLVVVPAAAGPDQTAEYLMEDSASMLDLGVLRLEMELSDRVSKWVRPADISVFYEWSSNCLVVEALANDSLFMSETDAKTWAEFAVQRIRSALGYSGSTGERTLGDLIPLRRYFAHTGFARGDEPETLYEELEEMLEIRVLIGMEGYTDLYMSCRGELTGTEIYFAR